MGVALADLQRILKVAAFAVQLAAEPQDCWSQPSVGTPPVTPETDPVSQPELGPVSGVVLVLVLETFSSTTLDAFHSYVLAQLCHDHSLLK